MSMEASRTTSSEPRNTVWRRSSRATDPPNLTRQDKGFNPQGGRLRHSNNGLKSRMRHPRPRIRMGGILGLFDLGSVTAFQGVDVVGAAVGAFIFLIFVLIFLFATLKVVKEYERIVNFRLGKAQAEKGPGIVVVIPGIDKPVRVDLRERFLEILPPKNVTDAMILQMSAERSRRAVVIEADGRKTATVTIAEGDKQSAVLRAEGARQAAILSAEGYAQALSTIFGAAKGVDEKTLLLQYLDALKSLGASPSTKFILPLELTQLIKPLRNMLTAAEGGAAKADDL